MGWGEDGGGVGVPAALCKLPGDTVCLREGSTTPNTKALFTACQVPCDNKKVTTPELQTDICMDSTCTTLQTWAEDGA